MSTLHACWKLTRVAVHIAAGLGTITLVFPKLNQTQKEKRIQAWAHMLLTKIAINLVVNGKPPVQGPVLLAANHISWLDIVVMLAACPCRFVSKAEVGQWPVVGALTRAAGTLFITRSSRRDALRVVHQMIEKLHIDSNVVLAIFPEGTTSNGQQVLPFHANLFQAAILANAPVQPVALRFEYAADNQPSLAPCYIDDDTLLGSVWRTLAAPRQRVVLNFGQTQHCEGRDRRTWALDTRTAVEGLLRT